MSDPLPTIGCAGAADKLLIGLSAIDSGLAEILRMYCGKQEH